MVSSGLREITYSLETSCGVEESHRQIIGGDGNEVINGIVAQVVDGEIGLVGFDELATVEVP